MQAFGDLTPVEIPRERVEAVVRHELEAIDSGNGGRQDVRRSPLQMATSLLPSEEAEVIAQAHAILNNPKFETLSNAHETGVNAKVRIGGVNIEYKTELPSSGFTDQIGGGFMIGPEAFTRSTIELELTVLQELYRLRTGRPEGTSQEFLTASTKAAQDFANRALLELR